MAKVNLFISYAHEDARYRDELKKWLHEKFCPRINVWDDGGIPAGGVWDDTIRKHLEGAHIMLLLISQDFILSDYIMNTELPLALKRHEQKQCTVIPIFTRYCDTIPKEITALQGLPKGMRFLATLKEEADMEYAVIRKEVTKIADAIIADQSLSTSIAANDEKSQNAQAIEDLKSKRKIFLSLPVSADAKRKRNELFYQAEGWRNYESWPYEIVPTIKEAMELEKKTEAERTEALAALVRESLYSIHMVESVNDLKEDVGKLQFELARGLHTTNQQATYRNIIWLLQSELRSQIDKVFLMNPIFTENNYGDLAEKIASLDVEKENEIVERKKEFFPSKKVYLYYDFAKDHNNSLRIALKTKIEEQDFCVQWNTPGESETKENEDLKECEGALIFYGAADPNWFISRHNSILSTKNLRSRAVCIDEPDIDMKAARDVSVNAFVTIKGKEKLDTELNRFLNRLK